MAKYRSYERQEIKRVRETHPIWRGIGCIILILVPILAYLSALVILERGQQEGWPFPPELMGYPQVPAWTFGIAVLRPAVDALTGANNLYITLLLTVVLTLIVFGVLALIYSWTYKVVGPRRYSPLDAPEVGRGTKHYRR
jgi:hypothetical protein